MDIARTPAPVPGTDRSRAFSELVAAHSAELLRMATRLEGNRLAGEELLQSAMVRTWDHFDPEWTGPRFVAYLRTAMVNAQRSRWRRPYREIPGEMPPPAAVPDGAESRVDDADSLRRALHHLPSRQRTVVVLRYYDDLSESQAAQALNCNVGTVKSQTSRALARLRPLLDVPTAC
jgi:RNA polymerase sigma-70 factor (sigma-E family)